MNVVVYVSDALRADHVGCYGARFVGTPTLDGLAASGLRFDQAIAAAPWTAPSMTSMVTGLYPHHHGYLGWRPQLEPARPTIFDAFTAAGHEVASFVFDDGFLFKGFPNANVLGTTERLDGVIDWLRAKRDGPFFLFVHSWATHMPRDVRHAERGEWRTAKQAFLDRLRSGTAGEYEACREEYRSGVEYASEVLVASLLEELDTLGLREQTAFLFVSDHGESWGERFAEKQDVKGIYHLHGGTLHDEILQVPLLLAAPGLGPAVVRDQVSTVDIVPALLELAGLPRLPTDGVSLLETARRGDAERAVLSATSDRGRLSQLGIRQPPWKLIRHLDGDREEGYRLDVDPRELVDRAPEVPEDLRFRLQLEVESVDLPELSAEDEATVVARLSDLGYL